MARTVRVRGREKGCVQALLDENIARYAPEYGDGLSNHAPMALIALSFCSASDETLTRFFTSYRERLKPRTDEVIEHFHDGMPTTEMLTTALVGSADDSAAAAFHGIIRVRFAWGMGHAPELAAACNYLAAKTSPLAPLARSLPGATSLADAASLLVDEGVRSPQLHSIRARHAALAEDARFAAIASSLARGESDNDFMALACFARDLYAARDDFTSLHALTGAEAALTLATLDVERARLYRATAHGVLACVANSAGPLRRDIAPVDDDWSSISRAACDSDDDHIAKLVVACTSLDAVRADPAWRAIAHTRTRRGHA
jgi:hypothetical protein